MLYMNLPIFGDQYEAVNRQQARVTRFAASSPVLALLCAACVVSEIDFS